MAAKENMVSRADAMFHFRNTGAGNFFLRGDAMSKYFGVGHHDKTGDLTHVAELQYNAGEKAAKGIAGQPLFLRAGFKYPLGKSTYTGDLLVDEKMQWSDKVSMPVTDNITVNSCLKYDLQGIFTNPSEASHKWGVNVEMKL